MRSPRRETDLLGGERGPKQSNSAVDVVADPPRGADSLVEIEGRDPSDREAVTEVDVVRHRERIAPDPGKRGDVRELHQGRVALDPRKQRLVQRALPRDTHPGGLVHRNLVGELSAGDQPRNLRHGAARAMAAI